MSGGKLGGGASFGGSPLPTVAGFDSDVNADINVTPMIDVMLVLLIIFMVVTPALAGYTAVLPKARPRLPKRRSASRWASTGRGSSTSRRRQQAHLPHATSPSSRSELKEAYAPRPDDHVLYLKADNEVGYDKILTAIDAARVAGVRRIGAITEHAEGQTEGIGRQPMAMGVGGKKGGAMNEINVTPMIDVLLVLLIIFMVVQQGLQKGVSVQVPPPKDKDDVAQKSNPEDQIVLEVTPGPAYAINRQPVESDQLEKTMKDIYAARPRKVIFVKGAENLRYGDVMHAVDASPRRGREVVGLVPRPEVGPATPAAAPQ
jgi:biopolymer transport protein TolR